VAGLLTAVLPAASWLAAALCLAVITGWSFRRQWRGELSAGVRPDGELEWRWRGEGETAPRTVHLHCDYLGPWLIGLRLNGRRLWLWPDSCSAAAHRDLRRYLIRR